MAIEIVDFPIKNGGSFHGKMLVHQRVSTKYWSGSYGVPRATSEGSVQLKAARSHQLQCRDQFFGMPVMFFPNEHGCVWKWLVPLNPMVNDHYPY